MSWDCASHFPVGPEIGMASKAAVSKDSENRFYGPTTAEMQYRRPDCHWLLQSYVWHEYDMFPNFPALKDFLAF
jgi:uncharacterized protein Usg